MATKTKTTKHQMIESPDSDAIREEYSPTVTSAKSLAITNKDEHAIGLLMLQSIAQAEKRVKDLFEEPKRLAHAAHKAITEAEKKLLLPLGEARNQVTQKVLIFQAAEQRKADEEARRLQEIARQQEEDRKLAEAIEAEQSGDKQAAEQIIAEPITVATVHVEPAVSKLAGISDRVYYRCKLVDLLTLVKYVAANPHELELLQPNETALRKRAESMKDGFQLPGCALDKQGGLAVKAI